MNISDNRFRHGLCGLVLAGLLVFTGCATTGTKAAPEAKKDASAASAEKKKEKVSVEYINVVGDGDRVMIGTTGTIHYTVFKLTEPSRLIVDMPGVDLSKVVSSIDVNNDYLNTISAISYGEDQSIGRIIINLKDGIDHDVKSGENSILVSLKKAGTQAQAPAENGEVAKASLPEEVKTEPLAAKPEPAAPAVMPEAKAPAAETKPAEAPAPMKRAARILKVESSTEGENTVVKITADGLLGNFNSFDLASPSRIVVDVWGVDNAVGKNTVKLKDKFVKDIRIGAHKDKSRLVLDLAGKSVTPHSVKRDVDSIIVTIGPKVTAEKEAAVAEVGKAAEAKMSGPNAPAPAVVASAAPVQKAEAQPAMPVEAAVKVENVDFKKLGPVGRLTITNSAKPEYSVKESEDGGTVVIDLKDAMIPDELSRTLDATKLGTTVATISSYQESTRPASVRVLVKLSEKTPYEVKEENGTINLDFKVPAMETAVPAAKKPAQEVAEKKGY
ncbi:MAG TPA: AMIN domain-containing protein, partial [Thermodesulfobacteriota bacterium]|nr:AMIN domain-containing protein [Thermodesulfobacteriota bacterium]